MRIKNWKKFILSTSIILITFISIFNIALAKCGKQVITEDYVVSNGETLWNIASEYAKGDIRDYIYQLREINNLEDCMIYPNQVIQIIK